MSCTLANLASLNRACPLLLMTTQVVDPFQSLSFLIWVTCIVAKRHLSSAYVC